MPLTSCSRCGSDAQTDSLLCPGCTDWLHQQTELDELAVVDAMQFNQPPIPSESPVQIGFLAPALPIVLELLPALVLLIAMFDSGSYEMQDPGARPRVWAYLASVFLTFGGLVAGVYQARLRPLRGTIISASVAAAMLGLIVVIFLTSAGMKFFDDMQPVLYWRGIAVALFVVPLGIALRRHLKIRAARTRLQALQSPTRISAGTLGAPG